jgi:hypothetical protein
MKAPLEGFASQRWLFEPLSEPLERDSHAFGAT